MKVKCSCGAKYEFDLRPEMNANPVRFVCPACGLDTSEFVDGLVRQELGQTSTPPGVPISVFPPTAAAVPAGVVLRSGSERANEDLTPPTDDSPPCLKHPGEVATGKCYVCSKPICPKCME